MAFRIGQRVVCVDATPYPWDETGVHPVKGAIYTVAETYCIEGEAVHLNFLELWWEESEDWYPGFSATRFRPVTEQKRETSISIFKEILDRENHGLPSRVDYPADCEPK